jgi:catechol 2,3-dioxygenase-like lactoylglutathione lyase family enzyme
MTAIPPSVTHVGVTVTDLDAAVRWYADVLGLELIAPPAELQPDEGHGGAVAADVFGRRFGRFRQAHLATANGVALELFEFAKPPAWTRGIFHVCLTTPAIDELAERIAASGGKMRTSRVWQIFPGEPYRTCYCEDPFGNLIELYSHSHERTYANRAA